ncbi:MAG: helix-turn-helix transcriptional regulator [Oscillospiraceae bacterium]|nr:helix-turn-helix transcriptional regulator [Oscillospiraceae bacterium]MBQ8979152.1 helix-turn-helix transcriptional regulator [Oscillospiraceae bacterium]
MYSITRMGCNCIHDEKFLIDSPGGFDGYLMLFVRTKALFRLGGEVITEPDTFIVFKPHTPLYYGACEGKYVNDWIIFNCTEGISADVRFGVPVEINGTVDVSQYFKLLSDCFYRSENMEAVGFLIRALMSEVFAEKQTELPHYRELLDLRGKIYASPETDWTVEKMARTAGISEPYLYKLYKLAFGVTCNADLIMSRIEKAEHYLMFTDHNIEEIAYLCGYSNTVHFSRQFKQIRGISPSEVRSARNEKRGEM